MAKLNKNIETTKLNLSETEKETVKALVMDAVQSGEYDKSDVYEGLVEDKLLGNKHVDIVYSVYVDVQDYREYHDEVCAYETIYDEDYSDIEAEVQLVDEDGNITDTCVVRVA